MSSVVPKQSGITSVAKLKVRFIHSNLLFEDSCIMSSPLTPLCLLGTHNILIL